MTNIQEEISGNMGLVAALLLFLSPLPTFQKIRRAHRVFQFSPDPYIINCMNCASWCLYAIITPDRIQPLITNGIGLLMNVTYVVLFLKNINTDGGDHKNLSQRTLTKILYLFISLALLVVVVLIGVPHILPSKWYLDGTVQETQTQIIGVFADVLNVGMYAGPLTVLSVVVKTESVQFMPLPLTIATLFCSCSWTWYSIVTSDIYIFIPNVIGICLGVIQLFVYWWGFSREKKKGANKEDDKELLIEDVEER